MLNEHLVDMGYHYSYHQHVLLYPNYPIQSSQHCSLPGTSDGKEIGLIVDHLRNRGNVSETPPSDPSSAASAAGGDRLPSWYKTAGGAEIDFHSAEFNRTDDLNDCSGNYRTFQSLDGVVTADMRHQIERLRGRNAPDAVANGAVPSQPIEPDRTEPAAPEDLPPLTAISRGRTLIIDTDAGRAIACGRILDAQGLICTLLVTNGAGAKAPLPQFDPCPFLEVGNVSITGAFGGFSAAVAGNGERQPLSAWLGDRAAVFDLVLDLQPSPSFAGNRLPLGYYAPGLNPSTLPEVMAEMPEMRGRFHRPQFTSFLQERCFHGRSRTHDCRLCVEVCPFGAIQPAERTIAIDHYRCQGCGGCALACPAEAIRMAHPSPGELLVILRETLENRPAGAAAPTLAISDRETDGGARPGADEVDHDGLVHFGVEQIGHVGLEMLLAALAYGAHRVVVSCGTEAPPGIREAAERQANMGRAILRGLDLAVEMIRFAAGPPDESRTGERISATAGLGAEPAWPLFSPPVSPLGQDRRTLVRLAAQHLYDRSGARQPSIPLPPGSPFGAVAIDPATCTLCMACAVACPTGALIARGDAPRLEFLESRCHQCGLCDEACPERAISLLPRLLCAPRAVETPAVLHEVEPFRCIECGVPFATQAMISRMTEKLTGHWMYAADRQLRRLRMCGACRTRDALASRDMKEWRNP